ncbi:ASST-domain-containing protein [Boeremia exigua]|uniref:ASST-domain-containing protein n=1 Tax=Boeremia exigua TaxID=749465 RepID=UPI001E8DDC65|nr:ASST-domain-containing protein [Boeremia exigua]KAH6637526.1 ASST-domain-containing protein [Boeremia exigua]
MLWFQPLSSLCATLFVLLDLAAADLDNTTSPTSIFRSRPDLHAPIINFDILRPELLAPGYLFLAPYRNTDPGPYIYDNNGQLVWSSAGTLGGSTSHNPHVCEYQGADHICFFQGNQHHGWARGHGVIMNNNYRVVRTVEAVGAATQMDMHEFRLIDGGKRALVTIYQPRQYDLGAFGVGPGIGWIHDSLFQEIDVETGELLFEWRALDHIAPSFSYTCIDCTDTSGNGLTRDTPWDFFHINSIDKNAEGDYLISARHVGAVYKISGVTGQVIWQLNGANPTFKNVNLHFSSQHHALFFKENATHTLISLFDNASNTFNITNRESRGMLIGINHVQRTASKLHEWRAPEERGILSGSQGNMQILPEKNFFIGWGDHAYFSEHLPSGEAVMYGKVAQRASDVMMYRCNKYVWKGEPLTSPSLWTYSRTDSSNLVFYVSWNGATEVRYWNFFTADSSNGPWKLAGTANKTGFETEYTLSSSKGWAYAEALDADHKPLKRGRSSIVKTFVPSDLIVLGCDDRGCDDIKPLQEGEEFNKTMPEVGDRGENYTTNLGVNTVNYYPILKYTAHGWSLSALTIPAVLILLVAGGVSFILGKRRLARLGAAGHDRFVSFVPGFLGGRGMRSDANYHKLETTDSM